jgi:hypothetical protein
MTPKQIATRVSEIDDEVRKLMMELDDIQSKCLHPDVETILMNENGPCDQFDGDYWSEYEYKCPDCGKLWSK